MKKSIPAIFISIFLFFSGVYLPVVAEIDACLNQARLNDEKSDNLFKAIAIKYQSMRTRPPIPEGARRFQVQAELAINQKEFNKAVNLYFEALIIAPWWAEGHFNCALILGELNCYDGAINEMRKYLFLVPNARDARAVKDMIYRWEGMAGSQLDTSNANVFRIKSGLKGGK
jgi:tetratricopeptide (TPR) repeat protein